MALKGDSQRRGGCNPAAVWILIALAGCLGSARLAADVPTSTVPPPPPANPPAKQPATPQPANPPADVPTSQVPPATPANPPAAQPANPQPATPPGDVPTTTLPPPPANPPAAQPANSPATPPASVPATQVPTTTLTQPDTTPKGPAPPPLPDTPENRLAGYRSLTWDVKSQGGFVMSMCMDLRGRIWVGLEEDGPGDYGPNPPAGIVRTGGVWRYDPLQAEGYRWTHFTTKDGLGDDNAYAIACDHLGRIWVGHLNHGVSVYNGKQWKNYDVLTGPLGPRIFAIAVCPTDGDVWMASDAGLARYSETLQGSTQSRKDAKAGEAKPAGLTSGSSALTSLAGPPATSHKPQATNHFGCWTYYTRAEGLPSDQANAIAFDKAGNIFVGTQCDGIAMAKAAEDYAKWTVVTGPDRMPNTPCGTGLPTNLINCLLVGKKTGTIYAGTTTGLAKSQDDGKTWSYFRGEDWKDRVLGLYQGPQPVDVADCPPLLPEDYVTALAEDAAGNLWIGTRQKGLEVVDPATGKDVARFRDDYANAVVTLRGGLALAGDYAGGLAPAALPGLHLAVPASRGAAAVSPLSVALPSPASPPTAVELAALGRAGLSVQASGPDIGYLGDDWTTRGRWIGRYGRRYAVLFAAGAPMHHYVVSDPTYRAEIRQQPGGDPGDSLRMWVQWAESDDPRVLYDPVAGSRREAEADDHGEGYASKGGLGIALTVTVPAGVHEMDLYLVNKDGHEGGNRLRDYVVTVACGAADGQRASAAPAGRARIAAFWGGVWKRFVVTGPATYRVAIDRNWSLNTIVSGVFFDKLGGPPTRYDGLRSPWLRGFRLGEEVSATREGMRGSAWRPVSPRALAALELWERSDTVAATDSLGAETRILAFRGVAAEVGTTQKDAHERRMLAALLERWRGRLGTEEAGGELPGNTATPSAGLHG